MEEYHANAPESYFDSISLWKTPIATCDNGQSDGRALWPSGCPRGTPEVKPKLP